MRRVSQFAGRARGPTLGCRRPLDGSTLHGKAAIKRLSSRSAHTHAASRAAFGNFHSPFPFSSRCPPARVRVCRRETMIYNAREPARSGWSLAGRQWEGVFFFLLSLGVRFASQHLPLCCERGEFLPGRCLLRSARESLAQQSSAGRAAGQVCASLCQCAALVVVYSGRLKLVWPSNRIAYAISASDVVSMDGRL